MKTKILTFILIVGANSAWATTFTSDGTDTGHNTCSGSVQWIHDHCGPGGALILNGDTITLPATTNTWGTGVTITKGITIRGQTTINRAGFLDATANDQTIVIDEKPRTAAGALVKADIVSGVTFRLSGITFRKGVINTTQSQQPTIGISATSLTTNSRIDHCHFDQLLRSDTITFGGWIQGVDDHNFIPTGAENNRSHQAHEETWLNSINGHGSWADYPYYGSGKFWFIEDNTIKNVGGGIGGSIDVYSGGDSLPDIIISLNVARMVMAPKAIFRVAVCVR